MFCTAFVLSKQIYLHTRSMKFSFLIEPLKDMKAI